MQATILFSAILLTATSCCCLALSPLHSGSTTTSINNGSSPRSTTIKNTIHRHGGLPSRRYHPIRPNTAADAAQPLSMVGGGGSFSPEPENPQQQQQQQQSAQTEQRWTEYVTPDLEVPTTTQQEPTVPAQIPPRPKIVVFGASGRIGRRIVKKLLSSGVDMDVVAFVRDEQKLERMLYEEEDLVMGNMMETGNNGGGTKNDDGGGTKKRNGGPRLQVVVSNVVSRRDVHLGDFETRGEKRRALDVWVDRATRYFSSKNNNSTTAETTTNPSLEKDDEKNVATTPTKNDPVNTLESSSGIDVEEALRDAIAGSSILISCLATYRASNVWTDYLRVPVVRVFRRNVARWSSDPTHPYYVNYLSTKKILEEAEKEQQGRDAALRELLEEEEEQSLLREGRGNEDEEGFESEIAAGLRKKRSDGLHDLNTNNNYNGEEDAVPLPKNGQLPSSNDRIKFIRISHLMLGHNPFRIRNIITNTLWSQVSKFELMGEMLMEASTLVDTIVLRPGDLTDDERNSNHTSLQLCIDGRVRYPSLVGREDVADLAVVSALTKTCRNETESTGDTATTAGSPRKDPSSAAAAHHYTWAIRWTGQHLSPPQGLRPDGLSSAALSFSKAIKEQRIVDGKRRRRKKTIKSYHGGKELVRLKRWSRWRMKPFMQSLAISVPLYATMGVISWYLFGQTVIDLFSRVKRLNLIQTFLNFLS